MKLPKELEPYRAAVEAVARPSVRLDVMEGSGPCAARYGGVPVGPPGARWPECSRGPLSFVGHLDFSAIAAQVGDGAAELPRDGILALFGCSERWPDTLEPRKEWVLLHAPCSADTAPLELPAPRTKARGLLRALFEPRPSSLVGPELRLVASVATSLPTSDEAQRLIPMPTSDDALWEAYDEEVLPHVEPSHQLLGYAEWVQSDECPSLEALSRGLPAHACRTGADRDDIVAASRRWRLLWQIDTDHRAGFMWGDAGRMYVFIAEEDLRERRFDRAWLTGQCY